MSSLKGQTALVTGASRGIGGAPRLQQADLQCTEEIDALVRTLSKTPLDILINNAGIWGPTPLGSTPLDRVEAMLDVNVKSVFWLTQGLLPLLREGARIVNVSSLAARIGRAAPRSLYGASKAAVDAFTKNWALELAPRKIRVNAVAPGYIDTEMTGGYFADPKVLQHAVDRQPFGRLGHADEVADVVLFLCSPASQWISGESV